MWCVNSDDRVFLRSVKLGELFGRDMVTVLAGLSLGEVVVTAGVYRLTEGESVKIIK